MASISRTISAKPDVNGYCKVLFRVTINHDKRIRLKSKIFVPKKRWNDTLQNITIPVIPKTTKDYAAATEFRDICTSLKNDIETRTAKIIRICELCSNKDELNAEYIEKALLQCDGIESNKITADLLNSKMENATSMGRNKKNNNFFELFEEYIEKSEFSYDYTKGMRVLMRILARYEGFIKATENKHFNLDINKLCRDDIEDFRDYIKNEFDLSIDEDYRKIINDLLISYPAEIGVKRVTTKIVRRGENSIIKLMKKFKAFYNWLNFCGYTDNKPFENIKIGTETFGTPFYLTLEERNKIADFDLTGNPALERQRDIFIFQCLVGCRVGDLLRMTENNIIDGEVVYIPNKTKGEKPTTVSVPLNERARRILKKYHNTKRNEPLLPFISAQKYNEDIKQIFTICSITRVVTVLNPTTGEEEKKPINLSFG